MGRICPRGLPEEAWVLHESGYPLLVLELRPWSHLSLLFIIVLRYQGLLWCRPSTVFPTRGYWGVTPSTSKLGDASSWRRLILEMLQPGDASTRRRLILATLQPGDASTWWCLHLATPQAVNPLTFLLGAPFDGSHHMFDFDLDFGFGQRPGTGR